MNSKRTQKLLIVCLIISICFIAACGKATHTVAKGEGAENSIGTSSTCYMGDGATACTELKSIDAAKEGYLNPYTDSSFMPNVSKDQYRMPIQAVDLEKANRDLKIAPSFKLVEFMSLEKASYGIFSPAVLKIIQQLRDKVGAALTINSGYRSPKWNAGIDGSAKWSRHQYGDGVDIVSNKASLDQLVKYCRDLGATFIDKYTAHVHCDWRNVALDPQFYGNLDKIESKSVVEEQLAIKKDLTDSSQIHVSGELKAGSIVLLSSTVTYKEDDDEIYKKWIITAPNGDQKVVETPEVSVSLQHGTYQIVHEIGINVQLSKTFFVN